MQEILLPPNHAASSFLRKGSEGWLSVSSFYVRSYVRHEELAASDRQPSAELVLKDCAGAVKLGDLSVEMRRLSLSSCSFFFPFLFLFSCRDSPFLSSALHSSAVCSLSLSAVCVVCLHSRLPEKGKKICGTNLNWALCCTLSCSMLSSCRKVPPLPVCSFLPAFLASCFMWRRVCVLHAGVCMRGECATCSAPSHSSVNVVAWLQQYLLYSYYFYYCGCLVKPDIITPVELFNCVVEHCS